MVVCMHQVETSRRLLLTAILIVIKPGSLSQIASGFLISVFYGTLGKHLMPFVDIEDDVFANWGQLAVAAIAFQAMLLYATEVGDNAYIGCALVILHLSIGVILLVQISTLWRYSAREIMLARQVSHSAVRSRRIAAASSAVSAQAGARTSLHLGDPLPSGPIRSGRRLRVASRRSCDLRRSDLQDNASASQDPDDVSIMAPVCTIQPPPGGGSSSADDAESHRLPNAPSAVPDGGGGGIGNGDRAQPETPGLKLATIYRDTGASGAQTNPLFDAQPAPEQPESAPAPESPNPSEPEP